MIYAELFWTFVKIGLFTIGGGYAALPLIQTQVVANKGWLTLTEFTDVITISQMTPGPIGINAATFVGTKVAGLAGAIAATVGCVFPSFFIMLALAFAYSKYKNLSILQSVLSILRPAIVGLIAASGLSITLLALFGEKPDRLILSALNPFSLAIFGVSIVLLRRFKLSPILLIFGSGGVGLAVYVIQQMI